RGEACFCSPKGPGENATGRCEGLRRQIAVIMRHLPLLTLLLHAGKKLIELGIVRRNSFTKGLQASNILVQRAHQRLAVGQADIAVHLGTASSQASCITKAGCSKQSGIPPATTLG